MNVNKEDIEAFSNQLINIQSPPVLWSSIPMDGNCFFHAIDYAYTGKLSKDSKVISLRQTIARRMKTPIISNVTYEEFIHGPNWPYAEIDVIMATAKYYKKTIIVISLSNYGGVTMIRPKQVKIGNPLFLICQNITHYVPFHSPKVKITTTMRNKLEQIEKKQKINGSIQNQYGMYISSFLLKDLMSPVNSLILTRKRLKKVNKTNKL
jgi:hypothetical protein